MRNKFDVSEYADLCINKINRILTTKALALLVQEPEAMAKAGAAPQQYIDFIKKPALSQMGPVCLAIDIHRLHFPHPIAPTPR